MWIIEGHPDSRASDVIRSARSIRRLFGGEGRVLAYGVPDMEAALLAGIVPVKPGPELLEDLVTSSDDGSVTFLPAGAVAVRTPLETAIVKESSVLAQDTEAVDSTAASEVADARAAFIGDQTLLSQETVVTVRQKSLRTLCRGQGSVEIGEDGTFSLAQHIRSVLHASGFVVTNQSGLWRAKVRPRTSAKYQALTPKLLEPESAEHLSRLITVTIVTNPDDHVGTEASIASIKQSDLASSRLILNDLKSPKLTNLGSTLFNLLIHSGHIVHPDSGRFLLRLMDESQVSLIRGLVDGSASPIEFWWTRVLNLGLQQRDLPLDSFARRHGDEKWIAASWVGIGNNGMRAVKVHSRFQGNKR